MSVDSLGVAGDLAQAQMQALIKNAVDLGIIWQMRPATVADAKVKNGKITAVLFDGDDEPIAMTTLIGPVYVDQRVMVAVVPPAANFIIGTGLPDQIGARFRQTVAQNIPNASQTTISWNVADEQSNGVFAASLPATSIRIPATGLWAITLQIDLSAGGGPRNFAAINLTTSRVTGAPTIHRTSFPAGEEIATLGMTIPMIVGDVFAAAAFQDSGSARTIAAWLSLYRVGGFNP